MVENGALAAFDSRTFPEIIATDNELSLTQEQVDSMSFKDLALLLNDYEFVTKETAIVVVRKYIAHTLESVNHDELERHFHSERSDSYQPSEEIQELISVYGAPAAHQSQHSPSGYYDLQIQKGESKVFVDGLIELSDSYESFSEGALLVAIAFVKRVKNLHEREAVLRYAERFFCSNQCFGEQFGIYFRDVYLVREARYKKDNLEKYKKLLRILHAQAGPAIIDYSTKEIVSDAFAAKLNVVFGGSYLREKDYLQPWLLFMSQEYSFEELLRYVGSHLEPKNYPSLLNALRQILRTSGKALPPLSRANLERLGVLLLTGSQDDRVQFFNSLNDLYATVDFSRYKPNLEATRRDVDVLELFRSLVNVDGDILDLGCGTGRHLKEFVKRGLADDERLIGVDKNIDHIRSAGGSLEQSVSLINGDWQDLKIDNASVKMLYSLGRSLPHTENRKNMKSALKEAFRVLAPGGLMIFDMPDPDKGAYQESRNRVEKGLKACGVPDVLIAGAKERGLAYISDGPEPDKLYNRYCPSPGHLFQILDSMEFDVGLEYEQYHINASLVVREVGRTPIDDGRGSENIYYVAFKPDLNDRDFLSLVESNLQELSAEVTDSYVDVANGFGGAGQIFQPKKSQIERELFKIADDYFAREFDAKLDQIRPSLSVLLRGGE